MHDFLRDFSYKIMYTLYNHVCKLPCTYICFNFHHFTLLLLLFFFFSCIVRQFYCTTLLIYCKNIIRVCTSNTYRLCIMYVIRTYVQLNLCSIVNKLANLLLLINSFALSNAFAIVIKFMMRHVRHIIKQNCILIN